MPDHKLAAQKQNLSVNNSRADIIYLREQYNLILRGEKALSTSPTLDPDLALELQDLARQLESYREVPGSQQTIAKYVKMIDEITNPESEIYKKIELIAKKMPAAGALLQNVDASHSRMKAKLKDKSYELLYAEKLFIDAVHRETRVMMNDLTREDIESAFNQANTTAELVSLFEQITNPNGEFQRSRLAIDASLTGQIDIINPTGRQTFRQCQSDLKALEQEARDLVNEYGASASVSVEDSQISESEIMIARKAEAIRKKHYMIDVHEQKFVQDTKTLSDIEAITDLDERVHAKVLFVKEKMEPLDGGVNTVFNMKPENYLAKINTNFWTVSAPILESQNLKEYAASACNAKRGETHIRNSELNQVIGHIEYMEARAIAKGRFGKDGDEAKVNKAIIEKISNLPGTIGLAAKMAYVEDNLDKFGDVTINVSEPNPNILRRLFSPPVEKVVTLSEFGQKSIVDAYRDMHYNDIDKGLERIESCINEFNSASYKSATTPDRAAPRRGMPMGSFTEDLLSKRKQDRSSSDLSRS